MSEKCRQRKWRPHSITSSAMFAKRGYCISDLRAAASRPGNVYCVPPLKSFREGATIPNSALRGACFALWVGCCGGWCICALGGQKIGSARKWECAAFIFPLNSERTFAVTKLNGSSTFNSYSVHLHYWASGRGRLLVGGNPRSPPRRLLFIGAGITAQLGAQGLEV